MSYGFWLRVSFDPKSNIEDDEWLKDVDANKGSDGGHEPDNRVIIVRGMIQC